MLLGSSSPELYAGIPGGGDLSVAEIEKWLADPKNHEVLEIELPLGLGCGHGRHRRRQGKPAHAGQDRTGPAVVLRYAAVQGPDVSCSSCHDPDEDFAAHSQFGIGIDKQQGGRNSPVSYNRILSDKQFWDGRCPFARKPRPSARSPTRLKWVIRTTPASPV